MRGFLKHRPIEDPPSSPRCSWCGSSATLRYAAGSHYCRRCRRLFREAPEVPFDVIADRWTSGLHSLQTAGEVIAVRLPGGFYGVCVLTGEGVLQFVQRSGVLRADKTRVRLLRA